MPPTNQLEDAIQLLATIRRSTVGTAPETVAACDAGITAIRQTLAVQRMKQLVNDLTQLASERRLAPTTADNPPHSYSTSVANCTILD